MCALSCAVVCVFCMHGLDYLGSGDGPCVGKAAQQLLQAGEMVRMGMCDVGHDQVFPLTEIQSVNS
jgi:hypothetical protein